MSTAHGTIDEALREVETARKRLSKKGSKQVYALDEIDYLKSVSYAWFNSHRKILRDCASESALQPIDLQYRKILDSTARSAARTTYLHALKKAKTSLAQLRGEIFLGQAAPATLLDSDPPPEFSPLASDPVMKAILIERWEECQKCVQAGAYLAATVMMGGLLEALFIARANLLKDKRVLFKARATPVHPKTKKAVPLPEWTLHPYIDVGFEVGWITRSGKDVAAVLRDYRNYVHPEKQRSHGVKLGEHDAAMFWDVTKNLAHQLLRLQGAV